MPIRVLPPELAGQIAAGEVVDRPASVVKELVENALDAAASQVAVELAGGGLRLIRVTDDGAGIPAAEVEVAFQRHATSKLAEFGDLYCIGTLGFRGEALPSIAAVSRLTMSTRPADQAAAVFVSLEDGRIVERGMRAGPVGTTVTVRQLFANVPARLKFLRSTTTETGHVSHLVSQLALAYPEVRFTLLVEGRTTFQSPGRGEGREAVASVYGVETARAMLAVTASVREADSALVPVRVAGFISPPSLSRVGRQHFSLFANRRLIQSRTLVRAVDDAYEGLLMVGRHPIVVLDLAVPVGEVDVNVHPAKREVKFQRDHAVYTAVYQAIRSTLAASVPVATFGGRLEPSAPVATPGPVSPSFAFSWSEPSSNPTALPLPAAPPGPGPAPASVQPVGGRLPILRVVGQVGGTYVIAEGPEGMYLIDQHAAHERVLFERLLGQSRERGVEVQGLLDPLPAELTPQQAALLAQRVEALGELGFTVEPFGEWTYLVRGVPAVLRGTNLREAFAQVVDALDGEGSPEEWRERACLTLACHCSIRAGQVLSLEEMRELVRQLERVQTPHTCPHGRPILMLLSAAQLEREFGRR